jgi:hypothetical protein
MGLCAGAGGDASGNIVVVAPAMPPGAALTSFWPPICRHVGLPAIRRLGVPIWVLPSHVQVHLRQGEYCPVQWPPGRSADPDRVRATVSSQASTPNVRHYDDLACRRIGMPIAGPPPLPSRRLPQVKEVLVQHRVSGVAQHL